MTQDMYRSNALDKGFFYVWNTKKDSENSEKEETSKRTAEDPSPEWVHKIVNCQSYTKVLLNI